MTERCTTCGRGEPCPPCAEGSPPPERLADLKREREQRHAQAVEQTRTDLESLPNLVALLPLFTLPGSRPPDPNGGNGHASPTRSPLNLDVFDLVDTREKPDSEAQRTDYRLDRMQWRWKDRDDRDVTEPGRRRQGILPTLVAWCRLVDEELWDTGIEHREYGLTPCGRLCEEARVKARADMREGPCSEIARQHWIEPTVPAEVGFLLLHLDWYAERQWFGEFAGDVRTMRADIRRAIGDTDPEPLLCPVETCQWDVQPMADGKWFRCTGCGRGWSWLEIHKIHERQKPKTLAELATLTGRPLGTLKDWAKKRWIKPAARDHRGALYSLVKVQAFALTVQRGRKKAGV